MREELVLECDNRESPMWIETFHCRMDIMRASCEAVAELWRVDDAISIPQ